eukprot:NODE_1241_length_636_cov_171.828460_g1231_i0.p2 GENE.NODE_1241_length_636_cov_171.828460_g1231_i0~~NODE_1241_length_636_cov_171.828460_g1231_i0.p2  ORF type:complete len:134 (+),score=6.34 NODE_1241_length_636_cov_171.828460_g1231_i0:225-626(+)
MARCVGAGPLMIGDVHTLFSKSKICTSLRYCPAPCPPNTTKELPAKQVLAQHDRASGDAGTAKGCQIWGGGLSKSNKKRFSPEPVYTINLLMCMAMAHPARGAAPPVGICNHVLDIKSPMYSALIPTQSTWGI